MSNKEDFKDFEAMKEETDFLFTKPATFPSKQKVILSLQRYYFHQRATAAPQEKPRKMNTSL